MCSTRACNCAILQVQVQIQGLHYNIRPAVLYEILALLTGHCICPAVLYEILALLTGHCMGYIVLCISRLQHSNGLEGPISRCSSLYIFIGASLEVYDNIYLLAECKHFGASLRECSRLLEVTIK